MKECSDFSENRLRSKMPSVALPLPRQQKSEGGKAKNKGGPTDLAIPHVFRISISTRRLLSAQYIANFGRFVPTHSSVKFSKIPSTSALRPISARTVRSGRFRCRATPLPDILRAPNTARPSDTSFRRRRRAAVARFASLRARTLLSAIFLPVIYKERREGCMLGEVSNSQACYQQGTSTLELRLVQEKRREQKRGELN